MRTSISRRDFLILTAKGVGAAVISSGLMGCNSSDGDRDVNVRFNHGVASGDPTQTAIILWTRITPEETAAINVAWEIATDAAFMNIVNSGNTLTNQARDYTVKVDAIDLTPGTQYYYRFIANGETTTTGKTKTLPEGAITSAKLAVMSCANYPAGHFNVYKLASQMDDLDAVLHLGDYIYEYPRGGYASDNAAQLNREVLPVGELFTLDDYRTRYGQYRTDVDLQALHAGVPFITVWDDHEVCNDTYKNGAENHNDGEGDFETRKLAALQAYFEWLPIRPIAQDNELEIYRSFQFGDLVDLHMLDTRVLARDKQLDYANYISPSTGAFDADTFAQDISDANRTMLGSEQLQWLQTQLGNSTSTWQLLGQQVLMGSMYLPAAVALTLMTLEQYSELGALAVLARRMQAGDPSLTDAEKAYLAANQNKLTDEVMAQLQLPAVPYNLDAWDGYAVERETILQTAKAYAKNLVVLAGDTHNAWASDLKDANGDHVGVEFATSSVSSPGLEYYLNIPAASAPTYEAGIVGLIENLKYCNLRDRGFMTVTFSADQANAQWHYVDTILSTSFQEVTSRGATALVKTGENRLTLS
ncbi:alkaline phosphatase D family protein [Bermanella sp. WJH001]|uniref:alkaline phosphatase D family protein n=1 Tax=Bermanella sp. WJH001 TaxID=3048005 RepID=UPI0024BDAF1D|nr:alkaline phosphatase D family protein [Bermanella sp. WJH001]MDJ1538622.1 alkaline phosphatase D family protein [Bermanella sp. WJH001]